MEGPHCRQMIGSFYEKLTLRKRRAEKRPTSSCSSKCSAICKTAVRATGYPAVVTAPRRTTRSCQPQFDKLPGKAKAKCRAVSALGAPTGHIFHQQGNKEIDLRVNPAWQRRLLFLVPLLPIHFPGPKRDPFGSVKGRYASRFFPAITMGSVMVPTRP